MQTKPTLIFNQDCTSMTVIQISLKNPTTKMGTDTIIYSTAKDNDGSFLVMNVTSSLGPNESLSLICQKLFLAL